jgi:hypothetical protein
VECFAEAGCGHFGILLLFWIVCSVMWREVGGGGLFTVWCVVWWGFGGDVCRCFVVAMTLRSCRVDPGFSAS